MTDPDNKITTVTLDPATGDRLAVVDPLGDRTTWAHNPSTGFVESMVTPRGNKVGGSPTVFRTVYTNDAYGRVTQGKEPLWSSAAPAAHQTSRTFDLDGNLRTVTDGTGNLSTYTYDPAGQLRSVKRPDDTTVSTSYDADGNMDAQVDGKLKATTYGYDPLGRLAFQADPLGRRTDFAYYPGGQLKTRQDPGGSCAAVPVAGCTTWSYNDADQPLTTTYSDGTTPNITGTLYDGVGRRTQVQRLVGGSTRTASYGWDSLGRMTSSTDEAGAVVGYEYNLRNLPTKTTYPGAPTRAVTRTWDDAGRATTVQDWLGHTTTYAPDEDSHIVSASTPVGAAAQVDTYGWDNNGQLASSTFKTGATLLGSLSYNRDGKGRLASEVPNPGGWGGRTHTYDYTRLDQLKTADGAGFGYDPADNLTGQANGAAQAFDDANQLCATSATGGPGTCAAPAGGTTTFGYDVRGNRTVQRPAAGPGVGYAWNQANQLTKTEPVNAPAGQGA
ncbi:MAG: hypothetical protein ABIS47_14220, partial [Acidimicrobiales bacterium]